MNAPSTNSTPWVGRLAVANAAALVVLRTVLTAPAVPGNLRFDPTLLAHRPWTVLTYPFVHDSVLHLVAVTLLLLAVGPAVERRMGSRAFLLYYAYTAIGAALFAVILDSLMQVPPMAGALAPVLGLAFARAVFAEEEEVALDPIPLRAPLRALIIAFAFVALVAGIAVRQPGLSVAHLGGLVAGWAFFRLRSMRQRPQPILPMPIRRPVMTPLRQQAEAPASQPVPAGARQGLPLPAHSAEEVNRVLDKISAQGIGSLTPEERQLLTEYSERKRKERP
jgi:membrane associated rhomboid family serine protease